MAGSVRTKRRKRKYLISPGLRLSKGQCFGIFYENLFVEKRHTSKRAENWLWEHPRIKYLIKVLENSNIIRQSSNDFYEYCGRGKVIIFCVHQGVARGLVAVLRKYIKPIDKNKRQSIVDTNVRNKNIDDLVDNFNKKDSEMRILVATDALSESINLHENCKILIHYELPWSPLRLLQRIGRLTRLKEGIGGKLNFNRGVRVAHIIIPGSVEEERINRLVRRTQLLYEQNLWPKANSWKQVVRGLLGSGPSMHLSWLLAKSQY